MKIILLYDVQNASLNFKILISIFYCVESVSVTIILNAQKYQKRSLENFKVMFLNLFARFVKRNQIAINVKKYVQEDSSQ